MTQFASAKTADQHDPIVSPLILVDRLISLAQDAERAGLTTVANRLVRLALRSCVPPTGGPIAH
ncbi:MAG TPA: hypothetical protein PLV07_05535 [Acidiphilium sp.]|jgi:hypothetical protein|uniref:hypothetical protein n=1 Tax=unclassified Acidiphilium TaxID=2617493 RepID=UPI000BD6FE4E|nr:MULTISPECIES: hypothetical protein [unclassified Acidiphilium]OYV56268.1 MAG: hypothetical protein B7Z76_06560 [Acidiphilium sp. 20-67-58]OYV86584.1 MAG: hypothetical protein B7Z64_03200 [Acidiphilium sp. 21-68-69]HQT61060.1 hypothetical protein [Acidiphilium sp.]HQU11026.1 hypothetical protein [Acidiphilium sp.]